MKAIRGATTVAKDCAEDIRESVKELLSAIVVKNSLNAEDIICIMFTSTDDIRSFYPAKAAREAGFYSCALFSAAEPDISGSLPLCIRVMVLTESEKQPVHVYLKGAAVLRKDISKKLNVAIDGPAGSGKSTVSKLIAEKLNILALDTGAMYRACALKCLQSGVDAKDEKKVSEIMDDINIEIKYDGGQRTYLDGNDVSEQVRSPEISMAASNVAVMRCVREKMVALQRRIASEISCVIDGRDIGSNVLPDAPFKFFLTASPEVRAKRRLKDNEQRGFSDGKTFGEILEDIRLRDKQDSSRAIAPLKKADDAILIDSSDMAIEDVVAFIERKIQEGI